MKKFVILSLSILVFIFIIGYFVFCKIIDNKAYSTFENKQLAQIIENSVSLISKDLVNDYNEEFIIPDIKYVCYACSVYSTPIQEITKEIYPDYKYSRYLEYKKHFKKGEGSSILLLIKENSLIPVFVADYFVDIKFSDSLKQLDNPNVCFEPTSKNITITTKKQHGERTLWLDMPTDKALITIK